MLSASRSSNAYKLQPTETYKKQTAPVAQDRPVKSRKNRVALRNKLIVLAAVFFLGQLFLCSRWVSLYGLHSDIAQRTSALSALQRANEQKALAIDSLQDASVVERYAHNELGMRKIEASQIVYVHPAQGDTMQKVAKRTDSAAKRGFFGVLSSTLGGVMEYLR